MTDRVMSRGDTLIFTIQVVRDLTTGVLSAVDAGGLLPPGNVPVDITGWFMWFTAKYHVQDADSQAVAQSTSGVGGGITFPEPTIGKATVTMPALATRSFPDGPVALAYDVQVKDTSNNISTVEGGTLTVSPDVTRAIS